MIISGVNFKGRCPACERVSRGSKNSSGNTSLFPMAYRTGLAVWRECSFRVGLLSRCCFVVPRILPRMIYMPYRAAMRRHKHQRSVSVVVVLVPRW